MRTLLKEISLLGFLGVVAALAWAGQITPPDPFLQGIERRGVLRVGVDPTYPPFEQVSKGAIQGYDVELAREIARGLGVRLELTPLALDTLYDALAAGKVDMLVSALPFVYERQVDVRYSSPYYQAGQVLLVREGTTGVAEVRDLSGKQVAVELGSNADTEARRLARTGQANFVLRSVYHSPEDALDALAAGRVDAAVTDNLSAQMYMRAHPGAIMQVGKPLTDEPYVVAVPAGAQGLAGRTAETIERLRASGELARIMGLAPR